jgi:shikimate 5-dehydrogenase
VTLYGRDGERARRVAARVGAEGAARPVPPRSWDLLVNATPVGTYPDVTATAYPEATFDGPLVYDLVYNPPATRLLCEARAAGCRTIPGLEMLVAQAQAQQRVWFGRSASAGVMAQAAHERLSASERDV